jgi:hypothetical protein
MNLSLNIEYRISKGQSHCLYDFGFFYVRSSDRFICTSASLSVKITFMRMDSGSGKVE